MPWIALPDIRALDGQVAHETAEHTNEAGIANSSARVLPAGTVVLSRTASVGFVTIMGREMATSQDFVNWVCGPDLEPRFLAHLLRYSREYILALASGAVHKTVYVPTVQSFWVAAPSRQEQQRIASRLDEQLAGVERARVVAEVVLGAARQLAAARLRQLLRTPEAEAWPRLTLQQTLAEPLSTGISRPTAASGTKSCLTLSAVRKGFLDLDASKLVDVSDREGKGNWVRPGGFYVVRGNGNRSLVGRGGQAPAPLADPKLFPDLLIQVVPDPNCITVDYLRTVWDSDAIRRDIEDRARTSAGIHKINLSNLAAVKIPVPALAEQRYLVERVEAFYRDSASLVDSAESELAAINALPAALLRRAFSGQI